MLIRFTVANYLSFKEPTELSFVPAAGIANHEGHVVSATTPNGIDVLKLGVIYGANASGKSNLVRAIHTAQSIVLHPVEKRKNLPFVPFKLDEESAIKPTRFEFEIMVEGHCYAYGFVYSLHQIEEEWLYKINALDEKCIFERTAQEFRFPGLHSSNDEANQFLNFTAKGTPPNRLFLTECDERDVEAVVPDSKAIFEVGDWFANRLLIIFPESKFEGLASDVYASEPFKNELAKYLQCFDTGIAGISTVKDDFQSINIPQHIRQKIEADFQEGGQILLADRDDSRWLLKKENAIIRAFRVVSEHSKENGDHLVNFDLKEESDGTRRLMDLAPAMMSLLLSDCDLIIDELDRSLHPDISHSYIDNFLRYSTKRHSQLIVTTHEVSLLDQHFLRPDEIWLVDKGGDGVSHLTALTEYKLNQTKDLERDYRQGRFGGIPVLRDFSWLDAPKEDHAETT